MVLYKEKIDLGKGMLNLKLITERTKLKWGLIEIDDILHRKSSKNLLEHNYIYRNKEDWVKENLARKKCSFRGLGWPSGLKCG